MGVRRTRGSCLERRSGIVRGRERGLGLGLCGVGEVRWLGSAGLGWEGLESECERAACAGFGGLDDYGCLVLLGQCSLSPWGRGQRRSVEELGGRNSYLHPTCVVGGGVHGSGVWWAFWMLLRMLEKLVRARLGSFG